MCYSACKLYTGDEIIGSHIETWDHTNPIRESFEEAYRDMLYDVFGCFYDCEPIGEQFKKGILAFFDGIQDGDAHRPFRLKDLDGNVAEYDGYNNVVIRYPEGNGYLLRVIEEDPEEFVVD